MKNHKVEQTRSGKFAVLAGQKTIAVINDEAFALIIASWLNGEPVRRTEHNPAPLKEAA